MLSVSATVCILGDTRFFSCNYMSCSAGSDCYLTFFSPLFFFFFFFVFSFLCAAICIVFFLGVWLFDIYVRLLVVW